MKISKQKQAKTRSDLVKIFILHGWGYSLYKWQSFVSELKNKKLNPVLLKIPGLTEEIDRPWDMDDYINWLLEKLEKEKDKVILLGHSNGGRIAMEFSIRHPSKISKLILIDSAGIHHNDLYVKYKRKIYGTIARIGRKLVKVEIAKNILYSLIGERDYKEATQDLKKTMINLLEWEKSFNPQKIKIPTTVIWGRKDGITPLSDGKVLNEKIKNSKLFIINDARHSPQFSHLEKVAEIVSENL